MRPELSRRQFIQTTGAAGFGLAATRLARGASLFEPGPVRVLSIGVIGTIGGADREQVAAHPEAQIVGLCDVDANSLARASEDHPDAFTCTDYREAFARHGDAFDAVIVSTPDHSHAPIALTALAHDKHVYGQKPLVHQLEEIALVERAIAAKPDLVTQVGNQRMAYPGRRAAVEILRSGVLGRALEAHAWTGAPGPDPYFNFEHHLSAPVRPPEHIDFDLWLGPCQERPYREDLLPVKWRSWWDFGSGGLGDWSVHVLDVIFFGFDELTSPMSVVTHAQHPADTFHTHHCRSTITYAVDSDAFAGKRFAIHYSDRNQAPSRAALGLPGDRWPDSNMTVVVCEGGVLSLTAGGGLEIWRDGELTDGLALPGLPEFGELNHWHAWIDNIVGVPTELRTPFRDGARITEAALLAVKASRFPGQELLWDKAALAFTNHAEATDTVVRRDYRTGFAPPEVG
ncbi:Gfo/Idh/MocA family protein [Engelhardtia mirabilis]|uniref:Inositol 2-dehydrogenase/D-chiro-inositol 3-dehydrogenase n=1 Tax=Engelhardtia mirabilis TaxID=2528011 RepID=A0A518BMK8_9BACT|nr:Inositol 2-dehydrogenase/D-chiro-inositol 3-dehydrogenase [Planctomycetes bacterium Pla133]QDV02502.1 Inositol 2-dehydrogenase/D-chiro-inositol 3-dehydrogenase [Planctomycetes bacterium Pla86]